MWGRAHNADCTRPRPVHLRCTALGMPAPVTEPNPKVETAPISEEMNRRRSLDAGERRARSQPGPATDCAARTVGPHAGPPTSNGPAPPQLTRTPPRPAPPNPRGPPADSPAPRTHLPTHERTPAVSPPTPHRPHAPTARALQSHIGKPTPPPGVGGVKAYIQIQTSPRY